MTSKCLVMVMAEPQGGSSSAVCREDASDRRRRDQLIQEEENLERAGRTIPPKILHLTLRSLIEAILDIIQRR